MESVTDSTSTVKPSETGTAVNCFGRAGLVISQTIGLEVDEKLRRTAFPTGSMKKSYRLPAKVNWRLERRVKLLKYGLDETEVAAFSRINLPSCQLILLVVSVYCIVLLPPEDHVRLSTGVLNLDL